MARSFLGALASALFKAGRATSNAHLAESILTGNVKCVKRSLKRRAQNKAKTALWRAATGKRKLW
jgi:uncharacterized cupin superfamily protein